MLTIGCHLSSSRGYLAMGKDAVKINANTFQFFTRNPKQRILTRKMSRSFLLSQKNTESTRFWHMPLIP